MVLNRLSLIGFLITTVLQIATLNQPALAQIDRLDQVAPGIFRGSQPETLDDIRELGKLGIKTIVNLRTGKTPFSKDPIKAERELLNEYFAESGNRIQQIHKPILGFFSILFPPSKKSVESSLEAITNPANQPVFVHCKFGKDRTGLIVGLYRTRYEQEAPALAYSEMLKFNFDANMGGLYYFFTRETGYHDPNEPKTFDPFHP